MAATNNKLIILICLLPHILFSSASAEDNDTEAYVDSLCHITKYQDRCVRSLSSYVSSGAMQVPKTVVISLLQTSLTQAIVTLDLLKKLQPYCISLLIRVINKLTMLLSDIQKNNNLQRLTSTALTDAETLVSKFQGRKLSKLEAMIYGKLKNVEETTSNALSLIQHYAATRH
ncbi:hypothetical protein N665_0126s0058 [Sinapis alba]|nr:hypothetical protein N665_0126s0058 [Sinapis alba]